MKSDTCLNSLIFVRKGLFFFVTLLYVSRSERNRIKNRRKKSVACNFVVLCLTSVHSTMLTTYVCNKRREMCKGNKGAFLSRREVTLHQTYHVLKRHEKSYSTMYLL